MLFLAFQTPIQQPLADLASKYEVKVERLSAPLNWKGDGYVVTANPPSDEQMAKYVPTFLKEWTLYPPDLMKKAVVHRIVFGVDMAVDGQVRGAVPAFDGDTMYYDPALGAYNLQYQRVVIHHEFFHMIDERMKLLDKDSEWAKLNPKGFHYGQGGSKMRESGVGALTDQIPGFLTRYGTAAVEEDKAELFAHMVVDGDYVKERAAKDPVLRSKIDLLKRRLSKFDPAMGPAFWKQIPAWSENANATPAGHWSLRIGNPAIVGLCSSPRYCFPSR